jgi:hypothetical protein
MGISDRHSFRKTTKGNKPMADRPQFTGEKAGIPAARVFVDKGQPGGREVTVPGILGAAPLRRTPHSYPDSPGITSTLKADLGKLTPSLAAGVRNVVARKR